ncbi:MAG: MraY family glycosyltransferase, partial [Planctomycetota bacterium]
MLSAILTAVVKKLAVRAGFVAHPAEDRFATMAVPLGGGIAIFATMTLIIGASAAALKFVVATGYTGWVGGSAIIYASDFQGKIGQLSIILLSVCILFLLGLWDDKKQLGPFIKLAVQFVVAIIAAGFAEVRIEFFIENKIITTFLSALWIVLIINAF